MVWIMGGDFYEQCSFSFETFDIGKFNWHFFIMFNDKAISNKTMLKEQYSNCYLTKERINK